ncbi:hypothetical protein CEXT_703141 [Caerostris extrusa]|uniref:Uncharacterized protein n=1 Tax=Caerostris extrusa TaxID=172846 RepID=A0AAV4XWG1_CAEEX|nr:hypothetical protein CEXT_703141 [Caerostris extrusa]
MHLHEAGSHILSRGFKMHDAKGPKSILIITPPAIAEAEAQLPFLELSLLESLAVLPLLLLRKNIPCFPPMSVLLFISLGRPFFSILASLPIATPYLVRQRKRGEAIRGKHLPPTRCAARIRQWGFFGMLVGGIMCRTRWALISGVMNVKKTGKLGQHKGWNSSPPTPPLRYM